MAVHKRDSDIDNLNNLKPQDDPTPKGDDPLTDYANSITFGSNDYGIMSASKGSDYTLNVAKALVEEYTNNNKSIKPKVSILDKEFNPNLAYSCIVISMLCNPTKTVSYFTCLLEATGRRTLTAQEIAAEIDASMQNNNLQTIIFTADDAINSLLHQMIIQALKDEYQDPNISFKPVDGVVVNAQADIASISPMLAAIGYNACYLENELDSNSKTDVNIQNGLVRAGNRQLKIESYMSKAINVNEIGEPVRTDWKLDLNLVDVNKVVTMLNMDNIKKTIVRTGGYVDAIPEKIIVSGLPGQPPIEQIRLRPQIVITANSPECPTLGYGMLGIVTSLVMVNRNMWLSTLRPTDTKNNVGALNVLTNINNKEAGEKLPLADKKYQLDMVYSIISNMFSLDPIVSYDIPSFGPQTFYLSALSSAAQSNNSLEKQKAAQMIVETASWLTSGHFPINFPINEIFTNDGVVTPMGKWSDKNGMRDIREIDLAFLAAHTDNPEFLELWSLSNLPKNITNLDPYLTKIKIISKIIPSAEITGKAVRVTFTSNFINTLENAAVASGLNVRYAPQIEFAESNNLAIMSSYLKNAGIKSTSGFTQINSNTGPNYSTPYTNVGYNRYR